MNSDDAPPATPPDESPGPEPDYRTLESHEIAAIVEQLESARLTGGLAEAIAALPPLRLLHPLIDAYGWLNLRAMAKSPAHARHFRALQRTALWPLRDPEAAFAANGRLRFDQMIAARYWGIHFRLDDPGQAPCLEWNVQAACLRRLASMLRDLHVLEHDPFWSRQDAAWITAPPAASDFEQLICDILNEQTNCASRGTLVEDLLEKTDLRVRIPGLGRKKGARVQITSTVDPILYFEKIASMGRAEEIVVLSPASLAVFAVETQRMHLLDRAAGRGAAVTADTAEVIQRELRAALSRPNRVRHELGPLAAVSPGVRQLIREYVSVEAVRSTVEMRSRLHREGPWSRWQTQKLRRMRGRLPAAAAVEGGDGGQ